MAATAGKSPHEDVANIPGNFRRISGKIVGIAADFGKRAMYLQWKDAS